jgi:adenylate cyclase
MTNIMWPRILVVDDTPDNVTLLRDLLGMKGYSVDTATNGTAALHSIATQRPDLVLLDIIMPDMSGYDVCRAIRARSDTQGLPVVLVTSLDASQERIKGLDAGADDFITKPINQGELLARVRSLLRIRSLYDTVERQAAALQEANATLEERVRDQVAQIERMSQLKRFFPQHVAELILAGNLGDPRRTRRKEVTIVFTDIRGFTAFTDGADPEEVIELLREYHEIMGRLVTDHGGALVYFAGDGMMIVFNDPVEVENPAEHAVAMALEMQRGFADLAVRWRRRGHEIGLQRDRPRGDPGGAPVCGGKAGTDPREQPGDDTRGASCSGRFFRRGDSQGFPQARSGLRGRKPPVVS